MSYREDLREIRCIREVMVGSRHTCNPPPTDTDLDILLLIEGGDGDDPFWTGTLDLAESRLMSAGWECVDDYEQEHRKEVPFLTARKGEVNLIIYTDPTGFGLFLGASRACKLLNLLDKVDRVAVHRAATEEDYFNT